MNPTKTPKVVCIPDSFKGSVTAWEAAEAMAAGVRISAPTAEVTAVPFADGGEGTLEVFCQQWGTEPLSAATVDALGRKVQAQYGISPDARTAVIEAAQANGLPQVQDREPEPLRADTYGVGLLAATALDHGVTEVLLCLGGSATTDGGFGLLRGLGVRFFDDDGELITTVGSLQQLHRIDTTAVHPRATGTRWRVATDVTNPLLGDNGAAAVFGPQKGASAEDIAVLESGLGLLAAVYAQRLGVSAAEFAARPGFGAAGGMPASLAAVLDAEIVSGSELVAETVGLTHLLAGADLVLTGEGRLDSQSLAGKVVSVITGYAPAETPVVAIVGAVELDASQCQQAGLSGAFSIAPGPRALQDLQRDAADLITETAAHITTIALLHR